MAIVEVKVPQLSESVSEATMLQWKKKPGEAVAQDEILIEIETDKVVLEVPAPSAGVLAQVIKHDGDIVTADELIAKIDTEAKAGEAPAAVAAAGDAEVKPAPVAETAAATSAPAAAQASAGGAASPAATKILAEKGVSADQVSGSGRDGRITKGDALAAQAGAPAAAPAKPAAAPAPAAARAAKPSLPQVSAPASADQWLKDRPEQRVPMSRLRARIAERLLESQQTNAILTTFNEVNMAPVMDLRNKYKDRFEKEHGVKLGFMSFFVKAAVHALKKFPLVNASIDGNDIVYHGYFDIGIAVGSPRGLVVPILRNADQMSLADIEKKIAEFGQKAKDGKLSIEEMTGGTFSISNGGVFGSMLSTPIINPPQSAILGVHATKERAVVENGQIVIRPMNYLALSYDHRIIDGREAVLSLVAMKDALEDPARLLLDL
ncbi:MULTISPECIES: 2-oxoglutarate dehydrogenase complex dihydrolipoyllysine-residue succinyltransferase [Caballeronia]|jgi:2-oxoglutarate dehydrogenase E2 component (dihydrolipoamide succinyltransferase)|uniref:Dihydrolipoyllysine-residue succinyltransferase component of 2-oxoglutarate dehydrogenase complex n=1 Tax=Caballeronia zhejiangensis TaxID=871203 RepID=A0A656QDD2_9BURK|nr:MULTISPECIES: 2-oxoglutarate dehydrogenase complex dihydrolipoyllysine-residue succinyltransferase [Caballeronia]EKS67552.1 dihydrolipoamide succinyltransferase [Burkholderia sp. SJ98]KDR27439.1 dihydrolipoamide succinyltransferase [Caballeronia zhejiangensis]MCG7403633.1 2-oxoglutarate dehydrogenase complex dihydrolipoyllysine-residue succinyltransferase [Caballeronia zhejiangensis]MCI1045542.1 2-oxoglutarate dehydrogenase complex dihydrolipoyllysine-residue succinyltransferase [Caballeroni